MVSKYGNGSMTIQDRNDQGPRIVQRQLPVSAGFHSASHDPAQGARARSCLWQGRGAVLVTYSTLGNEREHERVFTRPLSSVNICKNTFLI
jgi:hypothetical protein